MYCGSGLHQGTHPHVYPLWSMLDLSLVFSKPQVQPHVLTEATSPVESESRMYIPQSTDHLHCTHQIGSQMQASYDTRNDLRLRDGSKGSLTGLW